MTAWSNDLSMYFGYGEWFVKRGGSWLWRKEWQALFKCLSIQILFEISLHVVFKVYSVTINNLSKFLTYVHYWFRVSKVLWPRASCIKMGGNVTHTWVALFFSRFLSSFFFSFRLWFDFFLACNMIFHLKRAGNWAISFQLLYSEGTQRVSERHLRITTL